MKGETSKAIEFLKSFYPKGPWLLTSISLDKKGINTSVFGPNTEDECYKYLEEYNGDRNIYFTVNRPDNNFFKQDRLKKPNKEDIFEAGWLHVDIDPEDGADPIEERERILIQLTDKLPKGTPEPTVILFSGGGMQAFWKLKEPILIDGREENWEQFELYNKRFEQIFGGDHCFNVDRIMRLPGTVNVPDAKKRKKGRTEQLAKLLTFDKKKIYDISEFKQAQAVQTSKGAMDGGGEYGPKLEISGNIENVLDVSELDEWDVPDRLKVIMAQGIHPERLKHGDNSRSAWLFDFVCGMVRCKVPDQIIYNVLMDPEWLISSSVVELKGGADKYARRQISRAKEHAVQPALSKMNEKHAVIGNIGGKCRVIEEIQDPILHRSRLTVSSFEDLSNRYMNQKINVGSEEDPKIVPLGKYWLNHELRRQYDVIKFMPQGDQKGVYNLWRGFNVEPREGSCELYLQHLKDNVCKSNEEYYDYLIKWMARTVQTPASPGEVAVVLKGGKGTGKSVVATIFGRLFGRHFLHVANPSHLVGNFNAHLRDVITLFADEAFFAGDKKHESVLKMLITEEVIPIEAKGIDVEPYPNYVHLIMASNDLHVIRASADERRYFVLDVSDQHKQDHIYFEAIFSQMENGGYEALLFFLQGLDLTGFNVRAFPDTDALKEQKLASLSEEDTWWLQKLQNGVVLQHHDEWEQEVAIDAIEKDWVDFARRWGLQYTRMNPGKLGKLITRVVPHRGKGSRKRMVNEWDSAQQREVRVEKRFNVYSFGTLQQCRDAWEKINGTIDWDAVDDSELKNEAIPF